MDRTNISAISRRWDGDFTPVVLARAMRVRTVDASLSGQGEFVSACERVCVWEWVTSAQVSALSRTMYLHPSCFMRNSEDSDMEKPICKFQF